jgi:hypothetical protein
MVSRRENDSDPGEISIPDRSLVDLSPVASSTAQSRERRAGNSRWIAQGIAFMGEAGLLKAALPTAERFVELRFLRQLAGIKWRRAIAETCSLAPDRTLGRTTASLTA